ncbi:hypothetical protein [Flexithrix dorotheae]|uniref:hypothetical protein n=1 Tax=Flexithrix dorotheae TaxID=70993 RepID=UPI0003793469|nr:hypothetical protein [Flexithrix dorotheae]
MHYRITLTFCLSLILLIIGFQSIAQTNRYWAQNFNAEASLMGGAVVGGRAGNTAIFYNPALISDVGTAKLSINANLVALDFYSATNFLGTNLSLSLSNFILQPRFISFLVKSKNDKVKIEIASFTRDQSEFDVLDGVRREAEVFEILPGNELYNGTVENINHYKDLWFGGGASYKLSDRFTIGASGFLSVKSLKEKFLVDVNASLKNDTVYVEDIAVASFNSSFRQLERIKLNNYRFVGKLGMQYQMDNWGLGLNLTLPSINLAGKGEVLREISYTNIPDSTGQAFIPDFLISDWQTKLPADYKDPFSLALGFNYTAPNGKTFLSASIEYFAKIAPYKMITAEVNENITTEENYERLTNKEFLSIVNGANAITNIAIGLEKEISEEMVILGGVRTDFNFRKDFDFKEFSDFRNQQGIEYDVYHLTGGAKFNIKASNIILGIQYSISREKDLKQLVDLGTPSEGTDPPLQGTIDNDVKFAYNGVGIFFGFNLNFGGEKN